MDRTDSSDVILFFLLKQGEQQRYKKKPIPHQSERQGESHTFFLEYVSVLSSYALRRIFCFEELGDKLVLDSFTDQNWRQQAL